MSKKVAFPVMSQMISGVLYVVAVLLLTLRFFILSLSGIGVSTLLVLNGLVGFLGTFLIVWALISMVLQPTIEEKTKILFVALTLIIVVSVFAPTFTSTITVA